MLKFSSLAFLIALYAMSQAHGRGGAGRLMLHGKATLSTFQRHGQAVSVTYLTIPLGLTVGNLIFPVIRTTSATMASMSRALMI